jgi:CO/xanthine dehydrogenase Mo-binding subunit
VAHDITRRDFLKGSGALIVSFSGVSVARVDAALAAVRAAQGPFDTRRSHVDPSLLDSWISVEGDGRVTAFTGKCELGQGILTAQTQLVAEELCVDVAAVTVVQCDTEVTPDQGTTSGSQSTPTNFNDRNLALAAATARQTLRRLAAARWDVADDQLDCVDGAVISRTDPPRRISYGQLVSGGKLHVPVDPSAKRKPHDQWTVLGKPLRRVDMTAMATGTFEFVHNVHVPGMLHGAVIRPPSVGATLASVDEGSVGSMPGVVKVVVKRNFVAVVADTWWQAARAGAALKANWKESPTLPAQRDFYDWLRSQPSRDAYVVNSKDVDEVLSRSRSVVKATYAHPYQMHGSIGSSCAVADVQGNRATIWSPTQSAYPTRSGVAKLLGLAVDNVRVVFVRGSGCYGINGADTVSYDAALLSQAVGRPVRVQLTRKDEMAWENYGFPYVIDQRAGIDGRGRIAAWDYEAWFASHGGRPGYDTPGNVVTGMLAGFDSEPFRPGSAAEPPGEFRNGSNAAPSYVAGRNARRAGGAGTIVSERVLTHTVHSPFFTGPLRSPSRLQNTFAHECFFDEVAAQAKADPVEYRLQHLRDERLKEVVRAAARAAGWPRRPSPASDRRAAVAVGRGIACVAYEGDNGYAALVAEVAVDRSTGAVAVRRFVAAHDCGPISNPDGVRNQIEGGALQGLSRALGEEVSWDDRKVTSVDWRTYRSLPLGFAVPTIETVLIDRTGVPATGAGETVITLVAAAVGNAVFDATGVRLREVPFSPDRVKHALDPDSGRGRLR